MSTLVLCSGGLDSVTLAYKVHAESHLSYLLSFDYGQRHKKELNFAEKASSALGVAHEIIDISNLTKILGSSALTDSTPVPDGHYAEQSMMTTVVPNRNPIMLTIAFALAARENLQTVA
ncbi:MAG: 7-cyano-7-deazaguanine synthase, partial [Pseudomonadota bacterium]|nr:7-cyano-7-deazaguanine synthase [Pseudomonadota bacterium]